MTITSLDNERIAGLLRLGSKSERDKTGRFVVEGPHLVGEAVDAGLCEAVFATSDPGFPTVPTTLVSELVMKKIAATFTPQGIVAIVRKPNPGPLGPRVLLLDAVQDPGNLGTLLRTALAFGFRDVVVDGGADPYGPKTLRATQGAIFRLNVRTEPLAAFLAARPEYRVFGTDPHAGVPLDTLPPAAGPLALLLGNEGAGVAAGLLARTAVNLRIETEAVESLNVAVAGAIAMHRLRAGTQARE